jgi:hypothetical protein
VLLPALAWANPPSTDLGFMDPGRPSFTVFWLMELVVFVGEAWAYHHWLGLKGTKALKTSFFGNLASLFVGGFSALVLGDVLGAHGPLVPIFQWVLGVLFVEYPLILLLNRDYPDQRKLRDVVLLTNVVSYLALSLAVFAVGGYQQYGTEPPPLR